MAGSNPLGPVALMTIVDTAASNDNPQGPVQNVAFIDAATGLQVDVGPLTIGTTAITGGTDTRVLFQDGTTVGESAGLTFNKTSTRLSVGVPATTADMLFTVSTLAGADKFRVRDDGYVAITGANSSIDVGSISIASFASGILWSQLDAGQFWIGASAGIRIARDADGVLAQRNGANAQKSRLYASFTDASNGSWAELDTTTANTLILATNGNGTGAATMSKFKFNILGVSKLDYNVTNADALTIVPPVYTQSFVSIGASSVLTWFNRSLIASPADGLILLQDASLTSFGRLQFGGSTASFPAIKRSATTIAIRLADDSDDADITARTLKGKGFTVAGLPAAGTAGRIVHVTDQLTAAAAKGIAPTGGGAVVCAVIDTGAAWVGI